MAFKEVSVSQVKKCCAGGCTLTKGSGGWPSAPGSTARPPSATWTLPRPSAPAVRVVGPAERRAGGRRGPSRPAGPARRGAGEAWSALEAHHGYIQDLIDKGLTVVKVGDLLARRGIVVPERTLHRYCAERLAAPPPRKTPFRLADPEPGREAQTDFGRMGIIFDPASSRRRVVHALILVAVWSRHMFVWLTFTQTTADVIEGFELAWEFFRWHFPCRHPRQPDAGHHQGRAHRAPYKRHVLGVLPRPGFPN